MERRASGRLAGKAVTTAVAASTKRAAATVKGGVRKGSSNSKRQRSASPSSAPTANSNNDDADDSDFDDDSDSDSNFDRCFFSESEIDNNGSDDSDERSEEGNGSDSHDGSFDDDEDDDCSDSDDDDYSNSNDATKSHISNDAAVAATGEMPWGSSWWDRMPAEIRVMILDFVGPLQRFLNGQLGTKQQPARRFEGKPASVAIWVDAFKRDWKGNLDLLPGKQIDVRGGLCEVRSRSMYERLCLRFRGYNRLIFVKPRRPSNLNTYHYKGRLSFRDQSLLHIPARHGWFDLLDFRHPITLGWFAIKYGHPALLRHLAFTLKVVDLSQFKRFRHENAMDVAARSGSLEIVQMLHDAGNNHCTAKALDIAAAGGYLDVIQWLHTMRRERCTTAALYWTAKNGHLHVVKWLAEHYPAEIQNGAVFAAAENGHVDILEFLVPRFPDLDVQAAMEQAAYEGHLTVIKWFHEHRPDAFTPRVFTVAVERGRANVVRFLLDTGHVFDVDTIAKAWDRTLKQMMVYSLTLGRARVLLEDAKEKGYKTIVKLLEAAVSQLEKAKAKAKAKADKEAIPKKRKTSSK